MIWASVTFGLKVGAMAGIASALVFSLWDWVENPGEIFRDAAGTNWSFVLDTALSWLVPTLLIVGALAAVLHLAWSFVQARNKRR